MTREFVGPYLEYLPEPLLEFGMGQKLTYPRDGLFLYGPVGDGRPLHSINYGVIGTREGVRRFHRWTARVRGFIDVPPLRARPREPQHVPFPGFAEAFGADWPEKPISVIDDIDAREIERTLRIANHHEAVRATVDLYVSRLISESNRLESPPSLWFVVIPESVYRLGRAQSVVARSEQIKGSVSITPARARRLKVEPTLFGDEERQAEVYDYAPNFRRQLKARLLKDRIVTQIVRETTLTPDEFVRDNGMSVRSVEDPATLAWKFCTGAYYKAGGRPWQLADVRPGVCYVGLVYKNAESGADRTRACCAAQMFLTDGEGVVFRGALGPWFNVDTKEFHLDQVAARSLVQMVVGEYVSQYGSPPKELFIHAQSRFSREEWDGFEQGVSANTNLVGIQITGTSQPKLFRPGKYPVMRGTVLHVRSDTAFLWTAGYVPRLDTYMGPETPNPIRVRILKGSCPMNTVLTDILSLTKINFNSCIFNDRLPVTIKFANEVGDVLVSAPMESEPRLPFKFYI